MALRPVRYWFEFAGPPIYQYRWIGVTARTLDDARLLISEKIFDGHELPPVVSVVENVDVSTLDEGHVLPNMHPPNERGIWYPKVHWPSH